VISKKVNLFFGAYTKKINWQSTLQVYTDQNREESFNEIFNDLNWNMGILLNLA